MLAALLLTLTVAAAEPTAAELIARGEKLLVDLEYDDAAATLMRAAAAPDASDEQRLKAHLLAGVANRVAGHDAEARLHFRTVLLAAPETKLPSGTSPKVLAYFEAVRHEIIAERRSSPPGTAPPPPSAAAPSGVAKGKAPPPPDPRVRAGMWPWVVAGAGGALAAGSVGYATFSFYDASGKVSDRQTALVAYEIDPTAQNRRALVDAAQAAESAGGNHNCLIVSVACLCVPTGAAAILGGLGWAVYDGVAE